MSKPPRNLAVPNRWPRYTSQPAPPANPWWRTIEILIGLVADYLGELGVSIQVVDDNDVEIVGLTLSPRRKPKKRVIRKQSL